METPREETMNMQGAGRGSLWNNVWAQLTLLVIVAGIVIVLAAKYLW
jgi:hypothetical protein